ncbi:cell wall-binding repeat-containing protein [Schaalia sp. 19OD2882]|uniref:cell wall-binding repeat-containing protein n=1 Tax=Schaalia sp. 19OD2882 TaxID=2794089 RepID=UPI001C1ECA5E|nr:cell wall-binding repeat-containing protein [Schaalia sp. 19OD2882]QWW18834.1 cell wall-binding repeat-containing protein [Schaalia sp. 19OD2882]
MSPTSHRAPAAPSADEVTKVLDTNKDLLRAKGLSGTVRVRGFDAPDDGVEVTYTILTSRPTGATAAIAVPLEGGRKWAVPNFPQGPVGEPASQVVVEDLERRAETFVKAGTDLQWQGDVQGAVSPIAESTIIHRTQRKPYAVTCGVFVTMMIAGWDYQHSTYAADQNTRQHTWVDLPGDIKQSGLGQANRIARFFHARGQLWQMTNPSQLRAGDIVFYSPVEAPNDRRSPESGNGAYFGNVYHVALHLGAGRVIHSWGRASGAGVVEGDLNTSGMANVVLVARPQWKTDLGSSENADAGAPASTIRRLAGADRVATSVAVAEASPESTSAVLATGRDHADALVAAGLASRSASPIYLTTARGGIEDHVLESMRGRGVSTVTIVGGTGAVPASVESSLRKAGMDVRRIAGKDRFVTAVEVARQTAAVSGDKPTRVLLADGRGFADALSAGAVSKRASAVVLLTDGSTLPRTTAAELRANGDRKVVAVGGAAVSAAESARIPLAQRIAGADRYATAAQLAVTYPGSEQRAVLATGTDFPDALTASVLAAQGNANLLLSRPDALPVSSMDRVKELDAPARIDVVGGPGAVGWSAVRPVFAELGVRDWAS